MTREALTVIARLAILIVCSAAAASTLPAQAAPEPVAVGARVRLTLPDPTPRRFGVFPPERWLVGELVALTPDTLAVRSHPLLSPVAVPRAAVHRLQVSRGAPSRWRSAAGGMIGGALIGLLWGQALYYLDLRGPNFETVGRARIAGAVTGAIVFATAGALYPQERWRNVAFER
jgi:hypothetical protein